MTDGRTTLTTTVGVIAGVHDRTANGGTNALVAGLTGLTNLNYNRLYKSFSIPF